MSKKYLHQCDICGYESTDKAEFRSMSISIEKEGTLFSEDVCLDCVAKIKKVVLEDE